ncbi:adrenomedullin a [Chanos chanos]|uniref:Adrenomedullin a n=1 Tax=Chanos chanos TaxID=29144 RepID=A0A6J2UKS5_CHACN|nr:ADM [Chanos chanos]
MDKMNLILQSLFCCCLLTTVLPSVDSAKLNLSQVFKKSAWLQSRTRRDLNSLSALSEAETASFVRPEDVKDSMIPHSSTDISIRVKRSKNFVNQSRKPGCLLGTCTVHDLAHRIHLYDRQSKTGSAPADKISAQGYGRRRRSLPERQLNLQWEGNRLRPVWISTSSRLHRLEALLKRT